MEVFCLMLVSLSSIKNAIDLLLILYNNVMYNNNNNKRIYRG